VRIVRQLLTESVMLGVTGGVVGLLIAFWGVDSLVSLSPDTIPRVREISIDAKVAFVTLIISLMTGVVFGLAPALQVSKPDLTDALKESGRTTPGVRRNRLRSLLVVSEIALSLVLLIGAGLMIKSFSKLNAVDPGFNPQNLLTMGVTLLRSKYPQDAIQVVGFSNYARELHETELAGLGWDMVQGTNLHHALMIAGRHLDKHPEHEPVVLIVTDGEPTAHLMRDGRPWFDWPPAPETIELTLAEVDKMTRRHAALNIFMLADDDRLAAFVDNVAKRNGGRVLRATPERLGEYVVSDFLRTRGARR